ncbi:hypothetical protein BH11PLA2_BH11PLA2_00790 [soil metagenome]
MTPPDWLKLHDGSLRQGLSEHIVFVVLGERPEYRLDVRPAGGQYVCNVTQTVNGHRFDDTAKFTTNAAALSGGLEKLRLHLGW